MLQVCRTQSIGMLSFHPAALSNCNYFRTLWQDGACGGRISQCFPHGGPVDEVIYFRPPLFMTPLWGNERLEQWARRFALDLALGSTHFFTTRHKSCSQACFFSWRHYFLLLFDDSHQGVVSFAKYLMDQFSTEAPSLPPSAPVTVADVKLT